MTKLTIDLDTLSPEQAERVCGFILTYVDPNIKLQTVREVLEDAYSPAPPVEVAFGPGAVFGDTAPAPPVPSGTISDAGPSLTLPIHAPVAVQSSTTPVPSVSTVSTIDKDGLPWDGRIHASTKALNADGTWRLKRGVEKTVIDAVTLELKKLMAIPSPGPQLVPAPPAAGVAPPPPPANNGELQTKFVELFSRVSAAMSTGKLTDTQLNTCLQSIGVPGLPMLGARLDLVPQACALIDGVIAGANA